MPCRIDVIDRVIKGVAVTVEGLRITGLWDKRIGADKPRKLWVIVPAAIVVEATFRIKLLACEAMRGIDVSFRPRYLAPRIILSKLDP